VSGPKIKALIFDIGRVIVRVEVRRAQVGLTQGLKLTPEELWSAIEKDPRWQDWQEGRMSPQDWHQNLVKRLGTPLSFEKFREVWNSTLDLEPILPTEVFEELSKKYCLALLSNTDKMHVAHMESKFEFFKYFPAERRIYSCGVACSKPEPLIFQHALKACKAKAEEAVFIDDLAANVEAAKRLGMHGIQFQSPEQLLRELGRLGVLVALTPTK
jgi:glucose-1-phosphatase